MGADQRQFQRQAVKVTIQARDAHGGGELVFQSGDVSRGGAFLEADLLLEQGDALALDFTLPSGQPIRAQARVAWVRRFPADGEPAGMGLEFVSMDEGDRRALRAFLDAPQS